jgi:heat-inducible transcriptional repressor
LVEEFILTGQPVASGYLVSKYSLDVSPATVRNDLAYLEEHGFLYQPHFSSGRIPTDKAYRYYVEEILDKQLIAEEEKQQIESLFIKRRIEIENLHKEAASILAKLTRCLGLAVHAAANNADVKLFEIVRLSLARLLILLVLSDGTIYRREIEGYEGAGEEATNYVKEKIGKQIVGKPLSLILELKALTGPEEHGDPHLAYLYNRTVSELKDMARQAFGDLNVYISGQESDWLEAVDIKPEALLRLYTIDQLKEPFVSIFEEALKEGKIMVRVGSENPISSDFSIVIAPYRLSTFTGAVGVIGPKRMNYIRAIGAARFISNRLSEIISQCV